MPTEKKVTKKTTSAKPRTARARGPKRSTGSPDRVAVLRTHVGVPLLLRANPTEEAVVGFVNEHNRRYQSGEPGGPSGQPAYLILSGAYYDSEEVFLSNPESGTPIDL